MYLRDLNFIKLLALFINRSFVPILTSIFIFLLYILFPNKKKHRGLRFKKINLTNEQSESFLPDK